MHFPRDTWYIVAMEPGLRILVVCDGWADTIVDSTHNEAIAMERYV